MTTRDEALQALRDAVDAPFENGDWPDELYEAVLGLLPDDGPKVGDDIIVYGRTAYIDPEGGDHFADALRVVEKIEDEHGTAFWCETVNKCNIRGETGVRIMIEPSTGKYPADSGYWTPTKIVVIPPREK